MKTAINFKRYIKRSDTLLMKEIYFYYDGTYWFLNGKCHREDGPAIEWNDGSKEWWLNGILYTEQEYQDSFLTSGAKKL